MSLEKKLEWWNRNNFINLNHYDLQVTYILRLYRKIEEEEEEKEEQEEEEEEEEEENI